MKRYQTGMGATSEKPIRAALLEYILGIELLNQRESHHMSTNFDAQEHRWLRTAKRKFEQRDLADKTLDQRKDLFIEDLRRYCQVEKIHADWGV